MYPQIVYFEWSGILDHKKLRNNGVTGPLYHFRMGWNSSSLSSVIKSGQDSRASESVFLPTIQFIITSQGNALFEFSITVCRPSNHVSLPSVTFPQKQTNLDLKLYSNSEIFRYMILRPDFADSVIGIHKHTFLQGRPPNESFYQRFLADLTYALCPTKGATSPDEQQNEMAVWIPRVKWATPFSKKWWATCITPDMCWLKSALWV